MSKTLLRGAVAAALLTPVAAFPAAATEIAELRSMLNQMKSQYEGRIRALEARLAKAEAESARSAQRSEAAAKRAEQAAGVAKAEPRPMTAPSAPAPATPTAAGGALGALTTGSAFNPQISVILNGNYYQDGLDGRGADLVAESFWPGRNLATGVSTPGESNSVNGFNFSEAELAFSATVDPYFDAVARLSVGGDGSVALEEGWFQTRGLPYGFKLKGGQFKSGFGYINVQHPHAWDFADQNLPYLNLLGEDGLQDTGVQLTYLPPLPMYTLFGVELAQGDGERFGTTLGPEEQASLGLSDTRGGPRLWTAFAKLSPDLGDSHALQVGLSYAHNSQQQSAYVLDQPPGLVAPPVDPAGDGTGAVIAGLQGSAALWGVDLVYKYDGQGDAGYHDFKLQSEYLREVQDMSAGSAVDAALGSDYTLTTDGLYVQAIYGVWPRWQLGVRYDVLGLTNRATGTADADFGSSDRWTAAVTWKLSEFSRLRLQYATNDILAEPGTRERFDAFYLQFIMAMGSHGAHSF